MEHSLSYTFKFETADILEPSSKLNNIIIISEYAGKKHYVQYLQCHKRETIDAKTIVYYRHIDIKVDRKYYLEIANIAIDDLSRSRYFFSILGKRCFGATYNKDEFFLLDHTITKESLLSYIHKNKKDLTPILLEKRDTNLNRYSAYLFDFGAKKYAALFQENISPRKTLQKNYYVELCSDDAQSFSQISSSELQIEFLFSVIGKIYFSSFALERLETSEINLEDALNKLTFKEPVALEYAAKIYENRVYNQLKDDAKEIEAAYFNLYHRSLAFLHNAQEFDSLKLFSISVVQFVSYLREVKDLEDLVSYFTAIHLFADDGKLGYLLEKKDKDFVDIFLYTLECLTDWNNQLNSTNKDIKAFNIATTDLQDAMKYLFDTYLKFSHQYSCNDAKKEIKLHEKELEKSPLKSKARISAPEFCRANPIYPETIDELRELENDTAVLFQTRQYEGFLNESVRKCLTGYTSILNEYLELRNLSYSLTLVMSSLANANKIEDKELLLVLLQSLITTLIEWSKAVFIEQNVEDICYMDDVFYEYISQIEIVLGSMDEDLDLYID
ncbi:MAG: hypothetical protein RBR54_08710 [Sulfurimonas sp.]|jgi:hypothetical protein|nr:hypothetical protein [Sulfurimonas sp.]